MKNVGDKMFVIWSISLLLGGFLVLGISFWSNSSGFERFVSGYSIYYSDAKADYLENYFNKRIESVKTLSELNLVKDVFNYEIIQNEEAVIFESKKQLGIVSKQIQNYLITNSHLKFIDLVEDKGFQNIANQNFGETGYTIAYKKELTSSPLEIIPFFINDSLIDEIFIEDFLKIVHKFNLEELDSSNYFNFSRNDSTKGYISFYEIPIKTSDNETIVLISVIGENDYIMLKNINSDVDLFLKKTKEIRNYHDIILSSNDGKMIYSLREESKHDYSIEKNPSFLKNLKFIDAANSATISGPSYYKIEQNNFLVFISTSPVFENGEIKGFLSIIFDAEEIFSKINIKSEFENKEEFLINENYLLSSPIGYSKNSILIQEVFTPNSENCFLQEEKNIIVDFLNYRGEETLGTNSFLIPVELCFLVEFSKDEIFSFPIKSLFKEKFLFFMFVVFIFILILFIMKYYLNKNFKIFKNKRKEEFGYTFLSNISFLRILLIEMIFLSIYLILLHIYFRGIFIETFYVGIFDVFSILAAGLLLKYTYKIPPKYQFFYFWGCLLIFLEKLIEIFLQKYEIYMGIGILENVWAVLITILFVGIIFIINSLEGGLEKWK